LDEKEIIEAIRETFRYQKVDLFDDVAHLRGGRNHLVLKIDMFVESTDRPPGMTLEKAARKAVVACISDLACKGATPVGFLVSMGLPRKYSGEQDLKLLLAGLKSASEEYGVRLLGGDVNESKELVIDCAMVGRADRVITRGGARPGDVLASTGPFGYTALGLRHLLAGVDVPVLLKEKALFSVYEPHPKLGLCLRLVGSGLVTASMDSSDGLAITLNEMAERSGRKFVIEALPVEDGFAELCAAAGLNPFELALHGGEEYEAVLCIPKRRWAMAKRLAEGLNQPLFPLGRVEEGPAEVWYAPPGQGRPVKVKQEGWVHLA